MARPTGVFSSSRGMNFFGLIVFTTFIAIGCMLTGRSASGAVAVAPEANAIVAKCTADLAQRLKLKAQDIQVIETQATNWPDAALGMPENDHMYAQVVTPGWKVILEARGSRYLYTTSATAYRYGGPLAIWSYSMLYLSPSPDEQSPKGDLYQCSLLGTNSALLLSDVTDYYPQQNGVVLVKRRTSKTTCELLYVKANEAGKSTTLQTAFDFGDAAMNSAQDTWAAFVQPAAGAAWNIVVGNLADGTQVKTLPLPAGVRPGLISWSGDKLMLLEFNSRVICIEITPSANTAEWKAADVATFPGANHFKLSNNETLDFKEIRDNNNKPVVEVARVGHTGNRHLIATISGLTLHGDDFLGGRFAFLQGEENAAPATYTIDITTGEVLAGSCADCLNIKAFDYALISKP